MWFYFLIGILLLYFFTKKPTVKRTWNNITFPKIKFQQLNSQLLVITATDGDPLVKNMVVFKYNTTDLWLHSVIAMNPDDMKKLEEFGTPKVLVVPNGWHRLDAALYKEKYPEIIVTCPSFNLKSASEAVKVDQDIEKWCQENTKDILYHSPGGGRMELMYELRYSNGEKCAAVFCDQLFNLEKDTSTMKGWIQYKMGSSGFFGVSGIGMFFMKFFGDKAKLRSWFEELPKNCSGLEYIIVGHGNIVTEPEKRLVEVIGYLK